MGKCSFSFEYIDILKVNPKFDVIELSGETKLWPREERLLKTAHHENESVPKCFLNDDPYEAGKNTMTPSDNNRYH